MAGDTTSDLFVPSAHSWTDFFYPGVASLPLINFKCMICENTVMNFQCFVMWREIDNLLEYFFISSSDGWDWWRMRKRNYSGKIKTCNRRGEVAMEKPYWEGKEYSYFSHKKCEFFRVIRMQIRMILTVCLLLPAICPGWEMRWEFPVYGKGIKDCTNCMLPHKRKTMGMSQENTRNWLIWWKEQRKVSANKRRMRCCLERSEQ